MWVNGTGTSAVLSVSSNGGRSFANLSSTGLAGLACDTTATSASVLWAFCATGSLGYTARSTDGGREFTLMPGWSHGYKGDASNAGSIIPLSSNEAIYLPNGPYMYLTRDGGAHFSSLLSFSQSQYGIQVAVARSTTWLALGLGWTGEPNVLRRTTNSGRSWQSMKAPTLTTVTSVASCTASQLRLGLLGSGVGNPGQAVTAVRITDTSSRPCSLRGYPVLMFLSKAGAPMRVAVSHTPSSVFYGAVTTVVLRPANAASAGFIVTSNDFPAHGTACPTAASIRVRLPNMAQVFTVTAPVRLCRMSADISPVVKGAVLAPAL